MKPLICNLKMHGNLKEMMDYKKQMEMLEEKNIIVCPSFPFLVVMHSKYFQVCAQDISCFKDDFHTGSVGASALKSIDVKNALIGHSETNATFEIKIAKLKQALNQNMHVYVILSDTKKDYDYQYTSTRLLSQIRGMLSQVLKSQYENITFIYEPTWTINTKASADLKDIENIFYFMKTELERDYHYNFPFFYGGGLTEKNILEYYQNEHIDGLLLGNFSFNPENIANFVKNVKNSTTLDKSIHN
ncbi:TPA: triose-phosphate isomerase [Candidatus Ventrenecus avicola]|nr:triose-phosphate isomerase [Candidatus Ventrenecus avicola]